MGYNTKIQMIKRKNSEQWYVNFPSQMAQVLCFEKGEVFEWVLIDKDTFQLKRVRGE